MELHELEIRHLQADGKTVLFRRVEPQPPARYTDRFNVDFLYSPSTSGQGREQADCWELPDRPFVDFGDIVTTSDGLALRITSLDVDRLESLTGGDSAGWYWRVGVEVAE